MTTLRPEFQTHQFSKGLEVRRSVLGATYVDKSVQSVDPFMIPLQKLVTEYCWGEIWTRPGLARPGTAAKPAVQPAADKPACSADSNM